jgi:hypothetical protein
MQLSVALDKEEMMATTWFIGFGSGLRTILDSSQPCVSHLRCKLNVSTSALVSTESRLLQVYSDSCMHKHASDSSDHTYQDIPGMVKIAKAYC